MTALCKNCKLQVCIMKFIHRTIMTVYYHAYGDMISGYGIILSR